MGEPTPALFLKKCIFWTLHCNVLPCEPSFEYRCKGANVDSRKKSGGSRGRAVLRYAAQSLEMVMEPDNQHQRAPNLQDMPAFVLLSGHGGYGGKMFTK